MKKNKISIAIVLFLMFAMAISFVALPTATAQATRETYAVIGATPNPVGVGQETLLLVGITQQLSLAHMTWDGLSITIERPDGVTETIRDISTDSTGLTGRVYVPTIAGNYTLQAHFPEQETTADKTSPGTPIGTRMLASNSEKLTLVVQEEPVQYYPGVPLPTEYWTRPIDSQFREWATISASWLEGTPRNWFAPYNEDAPETAHILWTKPHTSGGLVGGSLGSPDVDLEASDHAFECGDAYEGKFGNRFVVAGKLYYNKYANPDPIKEIVCVDIRTGEELWSRVLLNNLTISRAQLMYWDTYDYHGVYDYLWATGNAATRSMLGITASNSWHAFDPFTGDYVYTLHSLPSGTTTRGPKGEILIYTFNLANGFMTMWNSTNIPALHSSAVIGSMGWGQWKAMGRIVNATGPHGVTFGGQPYNTPTLPTGLAGYQWNVSIPTGLPGSVWAAFPEDKVVGSSITSTNVNLWALSLKPGEEGRLLYNKSWNAPASWAAGNLTISRGAISSMDDLCTLRSKEDNLRYGFSTDTGDYLWVTEPLETLDHLMGGMAGETGAIAYGKLFSGTVSGVLKCFDAKTGELLWRYDAYDPLSEILWSNNWPIAYQFITDGKIYIAHTEHSVVDPKPRGAPFICLDVETGEEIWRIDGAFRSTVWGGRAVIGDSIIVTQDTYDQRVYAIGKGPSSTTVSASPKVSVHGNSVLVEGIVTDVSPGTNEAGLTMRFPNGVPAVADESMSEWMLYVYKQFPRPTDATGVEVVISVHDPNNNYYEVGRTTADSNGFFKLMFEPEVPGEYTVIAEFKGSKAYYGSFAQTAIGVEEAPAPTPDPTPPPQSIADAYFIPAVIGIIIAIVVVGAVIVLMQRKR
jgi:outer membrane protein assembly factor BamB